MGTPTTGVKLDEETRARLKRLAESKKRSAHWLMKEAIARYLEAEERYEQEKTEDEVRYQRYLDTSHHISQDEMMAWLDTLAEQAASKADGE